MRITINESYGTYSLTLFDTDGDGIINMEFDDEETGVTVTTTDPFSQQMYTRYDRRELKLYLQTVLQYIEKCEEL